MSEKRRDGGTLSAVRLCRSCARADADPEIGRYT